MKRNVMKKAGAMILAASMITMTGCGGSATTATTAAPATTAAASGETAAAGDASGSVDMSGVTLNFWSDKVGSGTYNMIVAMSKILEDDGGFGTVNVDPSYPGGMGAPYIFQDPSVSLSFVNGAPAKWAMETGTLDREPTDGYSAVIGGLTAVCYINCISNDFLKKYNVTSLDEIFEQKLPLRIGCSSKGSMDAEGAYRMLEYFGVTEDEFNSWGGSITNQGGDQNAEALADGQIDFYIDHTSSSSSTMAQIASTCDVTFLQWSDPMCQYFTDTLGFDIITVPANSFSGQTEELKLPGSPDCLFANNALDDDTVYMIVKTLSEHRDELVAEYASFSPWDPATAWEEGKRGGVALHPGAERYYKEMGYMN